MNRNKLEILSWFLIHAYLGFEDFQFFWILFYIFSLKLSAGPGF